MRNLKKVGATNLRFVKTGDNRVRTMTLWPHEDTADFAIEAIEALASSVHGVKFITAEKGPLLADLINLMVERPALLYQFP